MDVRPTRTRTRITNAFLKLLQNKPVERITVRELCELAGINKSTFYKYFSSIYDVFTQLEKSTIENVLLNLPDPPRVIQEPESCIEIVSKLQRSLSSLERTLPQQYWTHLLPKLQEAIRERLFECNPEYRDDLQVNLFLTYSIFGGYYAYHENPRFDDQTLCAAIAEVTQYLSLGIRRQQETGGFTPDEAQENMAVLK